MVLHGLMLSLSLSSSCVGEPGQSRFFEPGRVDLRDGTNAGEIERTRIQRHLARVEATLREETPPSLSPAQRSARLDALDALHVYWVLGEFPQNDDFQDRRVPYFIDDEGTACAVGHLMIASGAGELAREIATYENNDYVADIEHPGVAAWLSQNGLSAPEAAWIQPSYGPCGFGEMPLVCGTDGNTYLCEPVAVQCAGVEVAHEGACGSETGTDSGSGSGSGGETGGEVIGEEICVGMDSSSGGEASEGSGSAGEESSGGSGGNVSNSASAGSEGSSGGAEEGGGGGDEDEKGCGCAQGGATTAAILPLLIVPLVRRRRRR